MKEKELIVQGEKVFLRYIDIRDYEEFLEINKTSIEFYKGVTNAVLDFESFNDLVNKNLEDSNECLLICRNSDNKIVGSINLSQIFRKAFQNAYLGYSLGVNFKGKGYMTEAVQLILRHAFENLKLHRIEANVQPQNVPSINVLKRCGFTKEGFSRKYLKIDNLWRDHERWAIILEDWKLNDKKKNDGY